MNKAKTNALDALRALIAERQQYEQWMSTLAAKREGTPEHVFERVQADYRGRLDKVVADIRGHAEELQLSISTLSSRLVEVAREQDTRRESLQEAELRAAVGEYAPQQWESLKSEAEQSLGKIAADRASLDSQLGELRAIQKLSEAGSVGEASAGTEAPESDGAGDLRAPDGVGTPNATQSRAWSAAQAPAAAQSPSVATASSGAGAVSDSPDPKFSSPAVLDTPAAGTPAPEIADKVAEAASAAPAVPLTNARPRSGKTPPGGMSTVRSRSEAARPDQSKTLKCPECGTPNLPTEWYCERCGGELATM